MPTVRALLDVLAPAVRPLADDARLDVAVTDVVLLGPGDTAPDDPGAVLVCTDPELVLGQPLRAAAVVVKDDPARHAALGDQAVAVVLAEPELPWNHLLHMLTTATASTKAGPSGDLFALANAVAAAVGGAVAVEDARRRVLAYSSLPDQPIDEVRRQGILGRQVPDLSGNDAIYREVQRAAGIVRVPGTGEVMDRLAVAVRSGVELLGSLWVIESKPLGPDAEQALLDASRMAALHLLRARAGNEVERRARGELLRGLLDGRSSPELAGTRLGLDPGAAVTVLGLDLGTAEESSGSAVADLLHVQCSAISPHSSVLLQAGTLYALIPSGAASRARLVQLLTSVVERSRAALHLELSGAVGATVVGLGQVLRSRADVDATLRLARPGQVVAVEDVLPQVALLDLRRHLASVPHLRLPALAAMLAHDAEHDTPYTDSVLAYLAANADVPAAAAAVNVHANTFRYRMRRVRELFDLDLEDPDVRLVAWLQLRTRS